MFLCLSRDFVPTCAASRSIVCFLLHTWGRKSVIPRHHQPLSCHRTCRRPRIATIATSQTLLPAETCSFRGPLDQLFPESTEADEDFSCLIGSSIDLVRPLRRGISLAASIVRPGCTSNRHDVGATRNRGNPRASYAQRTLWRTSTRQIGLYSGMGFRNWSSPPFGTEVRPLYARATPGCVLTSGPCHADTP